MTTVPNPYRELEANISPREFERFCMDTLKAYAEQEHLPNFKITHDHKAEAYDGTYQIDVQAEYTALGTKNTVLVECKMYSSNVKRNIVETLNNKLQSLGAQKGIIISTAGYQTGAVKFAEKHGIALWQICNNYIKKFTNTISSNYNKILEFQTLVDQYLPKYFMMEWDCTQDYPYKQIYPTEEMYKVAVKQARGKALTD